MFDLVFPNGNEEKLAAMASRLGTQRLMYCYTLQDPHLKSRRAEIAKLGLQHLFAVYIDRKEDVTSARKFTEHVVARGLPGLFEDKRIRYLINFEYGSRPDFIHHRHSGLTQVSIRKAKNKVFLVNVSGLLDGNPVLLGRIMQNNRFFRKYRPEVYAVSGASTPLDMRAPRDLRNILLL